MSSSDRSSTFSSSDVKFLLTFIAGMGAFWLSGHVPGYLPLKSLTHSRPTLVIITLVLALVIYGLCMLVWSWLMQGRTRSIKPALVATIIAIVCALGTSLALTYTKITSGLHGKNGLAILVFSLYLAYGIYFVIGWLVSNRLAKKRG